MARPWPRRSTAGSGRQRTGCRRRPSLARPSHAEHVAAIGDLAAVYPGRHPDRAETLMPRTRATSQTHRSRSLIASRCRIRARDGSASVENNAATDPAPSAPRERPRSAGSRPDGDSRSHTDRHRSRRRILESWLKCCTVHYPSRGAPCPHEDCRPGGPARRAPVDYSGPPFSICISWELTFIIASIFGPPVRRNRTTRTAASVRNTMFRTVV